jgi:hypothetical protein
MDNSNGNSSRQARVDLHGRACGQSQSNAAFCGEGHRASTTPTDDFIESNHPVGLAKTTVFGDARGNVATRNASGFSMSSEIRRES